MTETRLYALIGRVDGVYTLVDRFYDHMDSLPEARVFRAMHGPVSPTDDADRRAPQGGEDPLRPGSAPHDATSHSE